MPDFTIETARTCSTNLSWSIIVPGSKGKTYMVSWGYSPTGESQYDWSCTCSAFKFRKGPCKHIRQVEASGARCGWNAELDPCNPADDNDRCPECGASTEIFRVAV